MGGGGAIRAAAKVGFGAVNCGFRGTISEHPVTSAARKASRHVSASATFSSADEIKANLHVTSSECKTTQVRAWSDFHDWEFAGGEEEEDHVSRLVFGGAPSFVEAKEATSELKDALEKTYLSSLASTGFGDTDQVGYSDASETKACLTSEKTLASLPSQHAIQAFRFLSENGSAQNVVASIASDPNVWNAVLQNPDLQEFLESQKSNAKGSVTDDLFYQPSPKNSDGYSENEESNPGGLADILDKIKVAVNAVVDMWSSLSGFFQGLFMGPAAEHPNDDGSARVGFTDKTLGMSFVGLAAMAMVVVVVKRK